MTHLRKTHLRDLYNKMRRTTALIEMAREVNANDPKTLDAIEKFYRDRIHEIRSEIRRVNDEKKDPLRDSLLTGTRRAVSSGTDMSDGPIFFWIEPWPDMPDEDCLELIEDETCRCHSPYDCSGEAFTRYFTYTRTPVGVVFIHAIDYDY